MRHDIVSIELHDFDYMEFINEGWGDDQSFLLIFLNGNITYTEYRDIDKVVFYSKSNLIKYAAVDLN